MNLDELIEYVQTPAMLDDIRDWEQQRTALAALDDAHKPDKHSTHFVNTADLAWGWINERLLEVALTHTTEDPTTVRARLGELVESWEFTDPPYVAMLDADGGLKL